MTLAAAYVRVSTREQERDGLSLPEQKERLAREAAHRRWQLGAVITDTGTGKSMRSRPALRTLLDDLDRGDYGALMVTRLDRLARSLVDFLPVLERSSRNGWTLLMLDPAVDTGTPYGRAMAQMAGVFAELEGALISQRTREGLEYARARGTFRPGEHLRYSDAAVIGRIVRWKRQGKSAAQIAGLLYDEGVPAPGGRDVWHPKTINRIYRRQHAAH